MSLLHLLGESMEDLFRPGSIFDHLGVGHHPDEGGSVGHSRRGSAGPVRGGHLHPWRHAPLLTHYLHPHAPHGQHAHHAHHAPHAAQRALAAAKKGAERAFHVNLDVQQFRPSEISVKVVDGFIVVEAKHEERPDEHGFISREFQRRYKLPEEVDLDAITSNLSSDGVLTIEAHKKTEEPPSKERVIHITCTNAPAVTSQPPEKAKKQAGGEVVAEKMDQ
ncbi:hypothetical protein R5R35_004278 [Gryllus longicercus]|uniref:SHSP domain-containing protein n=1 Tax=Gryllus longicercus TaxID=2509291 RepID=A0AAN9ZEL6_9ORTH